MTMINENIVKLLDPDSFFIQVDIKFAEMYGVNESILAGKMMRLEEKLKGIIDDNGVKWVRLTADEWQKEIPFFSLNTLRRTIASLEGQNIFLSTTFTGRSKWYRLNPLFTTRKHNVSTQNGYIDNSIYPNRVDVSTQNGQLPIVPSYPLKKKKKANVENLDFQPIDPEFGKISTMLLNAGLMLNQFTSDDFKKIYAECKPPENETVEQWFEYALKKASENQSLKLNYVFGIVRGIISDGGLAIHQLNRQTAKNQRTTTERGNNGLRKGNRGTQDDEWAEYTAKSQQALAQRIAAVTVS